MSSSCPHCGGELLTMADVAELRGVSVQAVGVDRSLKRIVEPDVMIGRTPVWKRETIEAWLASRPSAQWERHEE